MKPQCGMCWDGWGWPGVILSKSPLFVYSTTSCYYPFLSSLFHMFSPNLNLAHSKASNTPGICGSIMKREIHLSPSHHWRLQYLSCLFRRQQRGLCQGFHMERVLSSVSLSPEFVKFWPMEVFAEQLSSLSFFFIHFQDVYPFMTPSHSNGNQY